MNILRSRWNKMLYRCYNPNHTSYHNYGGRGISVCDEWHDFEIFKEWAVTNGFIPELSIDRIDNDLGYSPSNCRWATCEQQQRNRRSNVLSEKVASEIKWLVQNGKSPVWIAECYGVVRSAVHNISCSTSWETLSPVKPNFTLCDMVLRSEQVNLSKNNTSGYIGIRKDRNKWRVRLESNRELVLNKSFNTIEEAVKARENKKKELRELQ